MGISAAILQTPSVLALQVNERVDRIRFLTMLLRGLSVTWKTIYSQLENSVCDVIVFWVIFGQLIQHREMFTKDSTAGNGGLARLSLKVYVYQRWAGKKQASSFE